MSYYDVDAILTDAEKIPCEFQIDVPGLGYLDQTPSHTLKAGTRLNLPLWLAEMLALANNAASSDEAKPFLTLNLPPALRHDVIQALKADPRAVPLRDQSAHFYALATRMLDLFEDADLAAVLRDAFVGRTDDIGMHARKVGGQSAGGGAGAGAAGNRGGQSSHSGGDSADRKDDPGNTSSNLGVGYAGQEFLRSLDEWERQVFRQAHDGAKAGREFVDNVKRNY
ncbi:DNA replication protein [Sporothrix stenoceras]|uniref:DNA replication complex GINS protein PSF3 n=1 Tax=Sporothrix stenoceras TaxID=5173 RepID=A0ABR3ZBI9_9PEZI